MTVYEIYLLIFIIITVLLIIYNLLYIKEQYDNINWNAEYLKHKSKSFSAEKQVIQMYGEDGAWIANPAKTFSTEIDGIIQSNGNINGGFLAKTRKFY